MHINTSYLREKMGINKEAKEYKILFSIPIHEKPEVVIDQVMNIKRFNADCCIVFHVSNGFCFDSDYISEEEFLKCLADMDDVLVNPNRLRSGYEDIIQCHISNYRYAIGQIQFKYIMFAASNELFFRQGLIEDIERFDCGPSRRSVVNEQSTWIQEKRALQDEDLIHYLSKNNIDRIYSGQFEGSFMRKDMMEQICNEIDSFYDYREMHIRYAREEFYFHTLIAALYRDAVIRDDNTTYMDWKNDLRVSVADVINLHHNPEGKYSIKRVPRLINDEVRSFIREYIGGYSVKNDKYFTNLGKVHATSSDYIMYKKNQMKCSVYSKWLSNVLEGKSISEYLIQNGYTNVSLYGFGEIGQRLYHELRKCKDITIEAIIDKTNSNDGIEVEVKPPFPILSNTKLIIQTVLMDDGLMKTLKEKYATPCMDVYDLVSVVSEGCDNSAG